MNIFTEISSKTINNSGTIYSDEIQNSGWMRTYGLNVASEAGVTNPVIQIYGTQAGDTDAKIYLRQDVTIQGNLTMKDYDIYSDKIILGAEGNGKGDSPIIFTDLQDSKDASIFWNQKYTDEESISYRDLY